jgi:hypothetical protein
MVKIIPTWEVMKKRQIAGPGWCSLCKVEEESHVHLFLLCPFIKVVWKEISRMMGQFISWKGKMVEEAQKYWTSTATNNDIIALPLLVCWGTWLARNSTIF